MSLLMQQDSGVAEVSAVIEADPGLTACLLRAANSAASGTNTPIVRVADALVRIGFRNARSLVVASLMRAQSDGLSQSGIDLGAFWNHLLATGMIAVTAAPPGDLRSAAFTAGMLHDVGRLAMAAVAPAEYRRVVELAHDGVPLLEAEREVFGTDHLETGVVAAGSWDLPAELTEAISTHHRVSNSALGTAVHTGRRIAAMLGYGDGVLPGGHESLIEEAQPEDTTILASLGGPTALARRVSWFRGALVVTSTDVGDIRGAG
jgi:HD-like signal output (HDOD) protein